MPLRWQVEALRVMASSGVWFVREVAGLTDTVPMPQLDMGKRRPEQKLDKQDAEITKMGAKIQNAVVVSSI